MACHACGSCDERRITLARLFDDWQNDEVHTQILEDGIDFFHHRDIPIESLENKQLCTTQVELCLRTHLLGVLRSFGVVVYHGYFNGGLDQE